MKERAKQHNNTKAMDEELEELYLLDLCERMFDYQFFYFRIEEILFALKKTLSGTGMEPKDFLELMDKYPIRSTGKDFKVATRDVDSMEDLAALKRSIEGFEPES